MAKTTMDVTFKPENGDSLYTLKTHLELVESILDVTATAPVEVGLTLDTDYDDDKPILVITWEL